MCVLTTLKCVSSVQDSPLSNVGLTSLRRNSLLPPISTLNLSQLYTISVWLLESETWKSLLISVSSPHISCALINFENSLSKEYNLSPSFYVHCWCPGPTTLISCPDCCSSPDWLLCFYTHSLPICSLCCSQNGLSQNGNQISSQMLKIEAKLLNTTYKAWHDRLLVVLFLCFVSFPLPYIFNSFFNSLSLTVSASRSEAMYTTFLTITPVPPFLFNFFFAFFWICNSIFTFSLTLLLPAFLNWLVNCVRTGSTWFHSPLFIQH